MTEFDELNHTRTQLLWAIANSTIALLCVALALYCFTVGYVVAGVLTLVISVAAAWNAEEHKKKGMKLHN